jgi:Pyridoxamine 5'-phosphate oxidase
VFNTTSSRAKGRHLRRDSRVSVLVWDRGDRYRYIEVEGFAELDEEGAGDHIDRLSDKYRGIDFQRIQDRVIVSVMPCPHPRPSRWPATAPIVARPSYRRVFPCKSALRPSGFESACGGSTPPGAIHCQRRIPLRDGTARSCCSGTACFFSSVRWGSDSRRELGVRAHFLPKPLPPGRVLGPPAELSFGLGVRCTPDVGHDRDGSRTGEKTTQPGGDAPGRLRTDGRGERGQPLRDPGGLVVDDVVDPGLSAFDCRSAPRRRSAHSGVRSYSPYGMVSAPLHEPRMRACIL